MSKRLPIKMVSQEDIATVLKGKNHLVLEIVEAAIREYACGKAWMAPKISQIFNEDTQERINCMPATLTEAKICGVKWVSVFPPNPTKGLQNVSGIIILSEINTGFPIAVLDGTLITNLRTAGVGAVAAKYLARGDSTTIGFIGSGEQAKMHLRLITHVRPSIRRCFVASRRGSSELRFIEELAEDYPDIEFIPCQSDYRRAAVESDIIVTAISGQEPILRADWIRSGALYVHVGGWEDEYAVAKRADKIVCDEWESVKHRSQTISRMYKEGLLQDDDIYADLGEIVTGRKEGRSNQNEFIYFNSVGLAVIDIYFAYEIYKMVSEARIGHIFNIQG